MRRHNRYIDVDDKERINQEPDRHVFDHIVKYVGVFGSVQAVTVLVNLVMIKVKSILVGTVGYGITESLNRSTNLVLNTTNLGVPMAAVPEISRHLNDDVADELADKIRLTRSWAMLTALAGMALCILLAPWLSYYAFDGDKSYALSFVLLSLSVAATSIAGGETAVMRGAGMLRQIALRQLVAGVLSLVVAVPLYWFWGLRGIVPALVLIAVGTMAVTCFYSVRRFPYRINMFNWNYLRKGTGMIGFGIYFTIVSFVGSWAWLFIARYLTGEGGSELTGTYSAGYGIVTYLANLLLSVTDSEYYPRLSAAGDDMARSHWLVNSQSLAMCMLAAPLVVLFMICTPAVVYVVLEYEKFYASIVLAQMAVIGLFFKSVYQPISYLVLARLDSKVYVAQELICYTMLIVCAVSGYKLAGVTGLGISLAVWEMLYLLLTYSICRWRYAFRMSARLVRNFLIQGTLVLLAAGGVLWGSGWGLATGVVACILSMAVSLRFFSLNTSFVPAFMAKFFK